MPSGRPRRLGVALATLALAAATPASASTTPAFGQRAADTGAGWWTTIFGSSGTDLRLSALRFHTPSGWVRATGPRSGRAVRSSLVLSLAMTAGRRAELTVTPRRGGVTNLRARLLGTPAPTEVSISFDAARGERFFGFGERSDAVAQRSATVENYVSDGPFAPESRDIAKVTIPAAGYRARLDATYYPVPWLLSSRGYGVLVDNDETSWFTLPSARGGSWSARVAAPALRLSLFAGPTPARALQRFTAATGRQPAPGASWAFGPWLQTGQPNAPPLADQRADLEKLRAADAPVSAAETQLRYLPCGLDRGLEDYEAQRVAYYHAQGLAVLTYVNPMLCASYQPRYSDAVRAGALLTTVSGAPSLFNSFVGGIGPAGFSIEKVGEYDLSGRAGRAAYDDVLRRIRRTGHDGWMEDFGEYTQLDARSADGRTGTALHNSYPTTYHCGVARLTAGLPVVRFQRSGWTGAARCASDVWGGDPTTTFGFDGLSSAVKQALSIGLSGISRWGSDIGGYDTLGRDPRLTPELLKRWIEFGAVSAVMRIKKSGLAIPAYVRPQVWDPDVIGVWRRYTKLHTQLYPYLLAADTAYRETGIPLMRALVLSDPRDPRALAAEDEFRFGPDLLAAPVIRAGARSRSVYLPRGRWLDGRAALRYDARDHGAFHAGPAAVIRGARTVTARAALDELPLFVRDGAVLPLLTPDVSTLSGYGGGRVVRLTDRRDRLRLLAWPGPTTTARMFTRERLRSSTAPGRWTLRIDGTRERSYELEASTAGLRPARGHGSFRACSVSVEGRALPRSAWSQPRAGGILSARFRARRAAVVVRGC
ncbi:MAG: glycoside hydrolase family 31 protein [Solirubrobacteraceae bacterium]